MRILRAVAGAKWQVALLLACLTAPVVGFAAVDTAPSFWARFGPTLPYLQQSDLEPECRRAAANYTNFAFDYVDIRGNTPSRIAECYGHNVGGAPFYYFVYFLEYCPSGFGAGWQPVPTQCARVVPECPWPKVENPTTHVCEEPRCPPGSVFNAARNACVPLENPRPPNPPPPPSCPLPSAGDLPVGNPIYPLRGVKREEVDVGLRVGLLPVTFTYDTTLRLQIDNASPGSLEPGVLGTSGWYSSVHRRIIVQGRGEVVQVDRGDGYRVAFQANGAGFIPSGNHQDRLVRDGAGYRYSDSSAQTEESYDADGKLSLIKWTRGQSVAFSYSVAGTPQSDAPGPGFLLQAQDQAGRSLRLRYDAQGRLIEITDAAAQVYKFTYTGTGMLSVITMPDTWTREFLYMDSRHFWALTNVQNEYRNTKAYFGYDDAGRVISTEHSGGVDRYTVSYGTPPAIQSSDAYDSARDVVVRSHQWMPPTNTTLTDPLGRSRAIGATTVQGKTYLSSQSQPAGSGCAASTSSQGYDANGNVSQRDDFNGTRACYAYDLSRNLEATKVEGLATSAVCGTLTVANATLPANSRKVSTQWHPDWRLSTKLAEPGRITTSVYNGQPDPYNGNTIASCAPPTALLADGKAIAVLCKRVEQATTDATGALGFSATPQAGVANRVTTWTYNQNGQVLTENGPRTDVSDITTYAYYTDTSVDHAIGDLQSMTNAAGKVTQYTKYNKYGQLLESTDPNGVLTVNTYDPMQRLLSTTVGGQATSYSYDRMGQLKKVTLPDASWIGYDYDYAFRQTAVYDSKGNRTDYVLDNVGNRIGETTKDPSGALKRQLTRSIDALGRVQRITGRE